MFKMMTEIQTIEGDQKDVLLEMDNIKNGFNTGSGKSIQSCIKVVYVGAIVGKNLVFPIVQFLFQKSKLDGKGTGL